MITPRRDWGGGGLSGRSLKKKKRKKINRIKVNFKEIEKLKSRK
jgi:hypothetical protein